ncbi:MAG: helix-turn-helix domain-containing protein [Flavobacteriales bacterium]
MNLNLVSHDDLQLIIRSLKTELLHEIGQMLSEKTQTNNKEWVKGGEAREILSCSANTLKSLRVNQKIKSKKLNGAWYYSRKSIEYYFNAI